MVKKNIPSALLNEPPIVIESMQRVGQYGMGRAREGKNDRVEEGGPSVSSLPLRYLLTGID